MKASRIEQISATGDVTTTATHLRAVTLTAAAAEATLVLRSGGSGGDVRLTLKVAAETTLVVPDLHDALVSGLHATLTGAAAVATIVYA
jgi:hypothetical protein